ncbi:MAG: hypothetical protein VX733_07550 [Candidatus Latescibacterota bacterium]|nr:hypothetical protein [Candidatus Latescibacterota bacterium]
MRTLAVYTLVLGLAALVPTSGTIQLFTAAWSIGALVLLAFSAQQVGRRLALPAVVSWIAVGLLLGQGGIRAIRFEADDLLALCLSGAAVWLGLQVGVSVTWPQERRGWRLPMVVLASSLGSLLSIATAIYLFGHLPLHQALLFGAVGSLWGPIFGAVVWTTDEASLVGLLGCTSSGLLLSAIIAVLHNDGYLIADGHNFLLRLWISPVLGAAAAAVLVRLGFLQRRIAALIGLGALLTLAAIAERTFGLFCLPLGIGAGLVVSQHQDSSRQLAHLLQETRELSALVYLGLLAASADPIGSAWLRTPGLYEIVLIQMIVLLLARGIAPAVWYPLPIGEHFGPRSSWLLLPKGAITCDLVLGNRGLAALLPPEAGSLLAKLAWADLFIYGVLFATLAFLIERTTRESEPEPVSGEVIIS